MSYSAELKEELLDKLPKARHCCIAELAGIFSFLGTVSEEGGKTVTIRTEQEGLRRKYAILIHKILGTEVPPEDPALQGKQAEDFLELLKYKSDSSTEVNRVLLQQWCCKRAYLRGCFLAGGSITDPEKGYHFEIVARDGKQAEEIISVMESFSLHGKTVERQGHPVVYLKEGDEISDMLNVMEAPVALLKFENIRIQKDMNNTVNRKVNCETANIGKMVQAAVREVRDIELIRDKAGLGSLPKKLQETAELRLSHPEASLLELGRMMDPPVGKSGVNHRLRKIGAIADTLRNQEVCKK